MTANELADELIKIINPVGYKVHVTVVGAVDGCDIEFGKMYDPPPPLNLRHMDALGKLFGTEDVTVNGYSVEGCETCDFGSDYGYTINIRQVTNHTDAINELVKRQTIYGDRR